MTDRSDIMLWGDYDIEIDCKLTFFNESKKQGSILKQLGLKNFLIYTIITKLESKNEKNEKSIRK